MKVGDNVKIKTKIFGVIESKYIKYGVIIDINSRDYEDWFGDKYNIHRLTIKMDEGKVVQTIVGDYYIPFQKYVVIT